MGTSTSERLQMPLSSASRITQGALDHGVAIESSLAERLAHQQRD